MSTKTTFLDESLYKYMHRISLREPKVLQELREVTSTLSTSIMQISPEQGQFMRLLIELMGAKRTIEVGVYTGYSALSVAMALPDDGKMIACDINEEWTELAREFWQKANLEHKIELRLAPAETTLQQLIDDGEEGQFDFIFIDADKSSYDRYYEQCLRLIRRGGLILLDNTFMHGEVLDLDQAKEGAKAIHRLNEKILIDDRVSLSVVPIGDGITLARKR